MKKLALVFGGSRGIGEACVQVLAEQGFDVAYTYVASKPATQAKGTKAYRADVTDPAQVSEVLDRTVWHPSLAFAADLLTRVKELSTRLAAVDPSTPLIPFVVRVRRFTSCAL